MVRLENWHYQMVLIGGFQKDQWRLSGIVTEHPMFPNGDRIHVSTPKEFDEELMQITTASGRKYQLGDCAGNLQTQIAYIKEDVAKSAQMQGAK